MPCERLGWAAAVAQLAAVHEDDGGREQGVELLAVELAPARVHDGALRERLGLEFARDRVPVGAAAQHRQRHAVEVARLGGRRRVEVAVGVQPHQAGVAVAGALQAGSHAEGDVAVARHDERE